MDEALSIPGTRPPGCSPAALLRLHAGELTGNDAANVRAHAAACGRCGADLAALERTAGEIARGASFDAFAAGVRARIRRRPALPTAWTAAALALAAGLAVVVAAGPLRAVLLGRPDGHNLRKGGVAVELYVGGPGAAARVARDGEALAPGERVRVGYAAAGRRSVAVVSVDDAGRVTPLYPERGVSLPADLSAGVHLLPDSVEFTGMGLERVIAVFADEPLEVAQVAQAARAEFARARAVERMGALPLPVEQSSRLVRKAARP